MRFNISYMIRMSFACYLYALIFYSYVSYVIHMSLVCTRMPSISHLYVLVCDPYFTPMYSYVIRMTLVCHSYVTRMYSYVIRMALLCTCMSSVWHWYVVVCHSYATRMYSYVIRVSLVWFYHQPTTTWQSAIIKNKFSLRPGCKILFIINLGCKFEK